MNTDRRTILQLIALGRISPAEAERLLLAWNEGREILWLIAACAALSLCASLDPRAWLSTFQSTAHWLLPAGSSLAHHALSLITHLFGGRL
jgi:hypothetical protein